MIYVLYLYEVEEDNIPAFVSLFAENSPWRRISSKLRGLIHTDLMRHSIYAPAFLTIEFWTSQDQYLLAQRTAAVFGFRLTVKALTKSQEELGLFFFDKSLQPEL